MVKTGDDTPGLPDYDERVRLITEKHGAPKDNASMSRWLNANGPGSGIINTVGMSPAGQYDIYSNGSIPYEIANSLPKALQPTLAFNMSAEDTPDPIGPNKYKPSM